MNEQDELNKDMFLDNLNSALNYLELWSKKSLLNSKPRTTVMKHDVDYVISCLNVALKYVRDV